MQAWIDGPNGPGYGVPGVNGSVFINKVHKMMQGGDPPSSRPRSPLEPWPKTASMCADRFSAANRSVLPSSR